MKTAKEFLEENSIWAKVDDDNLTKKVLIEFAEQYAKQYCEEKMKEIENEPKEPYFGWCDVEGCNKEGCSGGMAWNDTGYWTVCTEHSQDYRAGKPQPKMKQEAIDREKSRDKKTGWLTNKQ